MNVKELLRTGDIITYRNGEIGKALLNTAFPDEDFILVGPDRLWNSGRNYDHSLSVIGPFKCFDIMSIRRPCSKTDLLRLKCETELIWEREEVSSNTATYTDKEIIKMFKEGRITFTD